MPLRRSCGAPGSRACASQTLSLPVCTVHTGMCTVYSGIVSDIVSAGMPVCTVYSDAWTRMPAGHLILSGPARATHEPSPPRARKREALTKQTLCSLMTFHLLSRAPLMSTRGQHHASDKAKGKGQGSFAAASSCDERCSCASSPRQSNLEKWSSAPRAVRVLARDATALVSCPPNQEIVRRSARLRGTSL